MINPIRIRKNKMILDKFRYKATLAAFVTMCFLTSTITKTLHIRFIMVKIQNIINCNFSLWLITTGSPISHNDFILNLLHPIVLTYLKYQIIKTKKPLLQGLFFARSSYLHSITVVCFAIALVCVVVEF